MSDNILTQIKNKFIFDAKSYTNGLGCYKILLGTYLLHFLIDDANVLLSKTINQHQDLQNEMLDIIHKNKDDDSYKEIFTELCYPAMKAIPHNLLFELIFEVKNAIIDNDIKRIQIKKSIINLINEVSLNCFEVFTPDVIKNIMTQLLDVKENETIFDPFAGVGGNLTLLNEYTKNLDFYGTEISNEIYVLLKLNLLLNNINYHTIINSDVFMFDENVKFNKIISDPPLGFRYQKADETYIRNIRRFRYGNPGKGCSEWLAVQYMLSFLKEDGVAVLTMPNGPLTRAIERNIRKAVVDDDIIECIIELPHGVLLPFSSISQNIIVFNKNKPTSRKNKILSINIANLTKNNDFILNRDAVKIIEEIYFKNDDKNNISEYIANEKIAEFDYNLNLSQALDAEKIKNEFSDMIKLGDVASEIFRGVQMPPAALKKSQEIGIKTHYLLNMANISVGKIVVSEENLFYPYAKIIKNYSILPNDIIITARGTFKIAIADCEIPASVISSNLIVIRLNPNLYSPYVLKYYLESELGRKMLVSIQTGSTATTVINPNNLKTLLIPKITIEKQNELSKKITETEEKYAQMLNLAESFYKTNLAVIDKTMGIGEITND